MDTASLGNISPLFASFFEIEVTYKNRVRFLYDAMMGCVPHVVKGARQSHLPCLSGHRVPGVWVVTAFTICCVFAKSQHTTRDLPLQALRYG